MSEKVEWEVVDAPAPGAGRTSRDQMKMLFGAGWRWKAVGAVVVAALAVVLFATVTSAVFLIMAAGAILSAMIAQVRQWLRQKSRRPD